MILYFFILLLALPLPAFFDSSQRAVIEKITDEQKIIADSETDNWTTGEILLVISKNADVGALAFVEVIGVYPQLGTSAQEPVKYEVRLNLVRQSRRYMIQTGDLVKQLDLSRENDDYVGTTDLLIRDSHLRVSSKYRPLVYQGFVIGDTAQTLYEKEFLVNYFGNIYYGYNSWLTLGTLAPVNVLGRPNANFRAKFYETDAMTLSAGMSYVKLIKEDSASLNLNLYWDSISTDALISHTFLGLGLISWDKAGDAAAAKYLTSSSFQTGYEIILNNWDRFLVGPSYNFDKKALGGYISYIWIMDRFHLQASLNATDVTHLRLDPTDGYYGFIDLFWRF